MSALLPRLARFLAGLFFRELTVLGAERIPPAAPLVVVANHVNHLVDPLLVSAVLPRPPRTLAKSTLWDLWYLRWLLDLAGAVPVYRRQDQGVDTARNSETFDACERVLAEGGIVALFPEGTSHDEPGLQPLRTGAARIALGAEQRFGPLGVTVLPIGLVFDDKHRFRSRVLVNVGEPFLVEPTAGDASAGDVRVLTERIDEALREQTLNYATWQEARLFEQAAAVIERHDAAFEALQRLAGAPGTGAASSGEAGASTLARSYELQRRLHALYPELRRRFPDLTAAVVEAVADYRRRLGAAGLGHGHLVGKYRPAPVLRYFARVLFQLGVRLPLALVGTVLNLIPYLLTDALVRLFRLQPMAATYKLFGALVLYPLAWLLEALAAGFVLGAPWAAAVALAAPVTGWLALGFWETWDDLRKRVWGFLLLTSRAAQLDRARARVDLALERLLEALRSPR